MRSRTHPDSSPRCGGFSLLELVVVAGVCAVIFSAGALAYRSIALNQRRMSTYQEVVLNAEVSKNFFPPLLPTGNGPDHVDSYTAPNAGRSATADAMRNLFYEDVEKSNAIFCLPRTGNINKIRQRVLALRDAGDTTQWLPQTIDTPAMFLNYLNDIDATTLDADVFSSYRGAPEWRVGTAPDFSYHTNGSVFMMQPSGSNAELWVRAVWEIDYVGQTSTNEKSAIFKNQDGSAADLPWLYASVRRYRSSVLTHYYDVVIRDAKLEQVGVPFVHFERNVRTNLTEAGPAAVFKLAGNQPFYLIWWPDPAVHKMNSTASAATYTGSSPQSYYWQHEGQTSYWFVVPQFPAL